MSAQKVPPLTDAASILAGFKVAAQWLDEYAEAKQTLARREEALRMALLHLRGTFSPKAVGAKAGVAGPTVSGMFCGHTKLPVDTMRRILKHAKADAVKP